MPEQYTAEDAAQAIAQAWAEDEGTPSPAVPAQEAPSEGQVTSNQEGEKPAGLFYDVDPNTLTPDLRRMFDGMQASYTQKNQELANERKQIEAYGGFDQVQQAMEFVQGLQDPENLVSLHDELSQYLQQAGYTKATAEAAATSALQEPQFESSEADYGFADPEVSQLKQELDALKQWQSGFEQQQEQARIENELARMENVLRQDRSYNDTDVSRVYQLSYAYGADLFAAADAYDAMKQDVISSYINSKAEAVTSVVPPANATLGQIPPEGFGSDFEAAHKEAKRIALAAFNAGAFDE